MNTTTNTKKGANPFANKARTNVANFVRECGGIFQYASAIEQAFENYFGEIGSPYKRITTFASDFAIAECYGDNSIKDTFYKAWGDKKTDSESLRSYKEEARSYFFHTLD